MSAYPRMDPYRRSRYEHGIDAKVVVMGNSGVGKTSLLQRYTHNKFDPKNTTSTTGAFFVAKKVTVNGVKVRLQLWDTAGQERFRSMAPMYYRGANAALLLYDITNPASFQDVHGWLRELKKNCPTDLITYIVGSKADLSHLRQVSSDLARLSLHQWFPPPRPPPPPPPPPQLSAFSYIRPRFTSFTSIRSAPLTMSSPSKPSPPDSHSSSLDTPPSRAGAALRRAQTGGASARGNSPWTEAPDHESGSGMDEYDDDTGDEREWGLEKGMELFEVSAKDDSGISQLFDALITAIIVKKDTIEHENELKRRDSVMLTPVTPPTWAAQADEEEAREKAAARSHAARSCCQT
ncbi:P-loop containing nucleoside triphosphate hydrolase protein [Multifurca ochricompacta]|uniref:P-loop containing nucleoside triphosphate hydrolase protein n=1 Tax=Multifurca ochricompacta TaxID=376703 RepID=A0AAD4QKD2_9AGAM|nr:P-loop containing nucleoside triphosphate hydrolase protein [Multifurca ochricompacta]